MINLTPCKDDEADASNDENGAFIYPDLETALVGSFNVADKTLLEASEAVIGSVNVNSFGIMEPIFNEVKSQSSARKIFLFIQCYLQIFVGS